MIPSVTGFLEQDFEIETQPTNTYKMELESNLIRGYTDGQEAMKRLFSKSFPRNDTNMLCILGTMGLN